MATRSLCQFSSKRLDVLRIEKYEKWYFADLPGGGIHWIHDKKKKTPEFQAEDTRQKELVHSLYASITVSGHRYSTPPLAMSPLGVIFLFFWNGSVNFRGECVWSGTAGLLFGTMDFFRAPAKDTETVSLWLCACHTQCGICFALLEHTGHSKSHTTKRCWEWLCKTHNIPPRGFMTTGTSSIAARGS